jgi:hypothetical protein
MTALSRDDQRKQSHDETGQCAYEAIVELLDGLYDWQTAAEAEGWTGPHKDKYGVTFFSDPTVVGKATWACSSWKELCKAMDIEPERSESGEQAILEDPLSVMVRDGWRSPSGQVDEGPEEYEILLSTGGPATRIIGKLNKYSEPETASLQVQDWFVPWQEWRGEGFSEETLLTYARCFYYGD